MNAENADKFAREYARQSELLRQACQIFTQALGDETGYIPSLGRAATMMALQFMREAGVQPVFHGQGPETREWA